MLEIERKFRVKNTEFIQQAVHFAQIAQGYLNSDAERIVRVRLKNNQGFLTIKGASSSDGTTRFEWEKEIAKEDAQQLLSLCEPGAIQKTRYFIPAGDLQFEVDVFEGENQGLIIAEIELPSADHAFEKPDWLGEEVTHDPRYYNAYLTHQPYSKWKDQP